MNSNEINIAVVGATGAAGGTALELLLERNHPADKIVAMASERSAGKKIQYGDAELTIIHATVDAFEGVDVALFAAGGYVSRRLAHKAVEKGVFVIDKGSIFRMDPTIPLVVPEVNGDDIEWHPRNRFDSELHEHSTCDGSRCVTQTISDYSGYRGDLPVGNWDRRCSQ